MFGNNFCTGPKGFTSVQHYHRNGVRQKMKCFKARDINIMMIMISFVVFAMIFTFSILSGIKLRNFHNSLNKHHVFKKSSLQIKDTSNYLTDQARLFTITGDIKYADKYFYEKNINKEKNATLQNLLNVFDYDEIEFKKLSTAFSQSENLISIEMYAMKLKFMAEGIPETEIPQELQDITIREQDRFLSKKEMADRSINMLFDSGYLIYKMRINENCDCMINSIDDANEKEVSDNLDNLSEKIAYLGATQILMFIIIAAFFIVNITLIIRPINSYMDSINQDSKLKEAGSYELRLLASIYNKFFDMKAENETRLRKHADTDSLTGLLNRRAFSQICRDSATDKNVVLLIIDVDDFKHINDTYGHTAGDTVLKTIANELVQTFRTTDYVSRIGGDEFAVLLTGFKGNANLMLKRKINKLNNKLKGLKEFGGISLSVGAVQSSEGYNATLVEMADSALYKTKNEGKCGCNVVTIKNS